MVQGWKDQGFTNHFIKSIRTSVWTGQSLEPWKGAHVVGHYADVARLVGLTENELYTQLKNIKQHANLSKFLKGSPDPSHFIFEINVGQRRIRLRTILKFNF